MNAGWMLAGVRRRPSVEPNGSNIPVEKHPCPTHSANGAAERRGMHRRWGTMGKDGKDSLRRTATLTRSQVMELDRLAERDGVSVSWLLRKGAEMVIERANDGPLLPGLGGDRHGAG